MNGNVRTYGLRMGKLRSDVIGCASFRHAYMRKSGTLNP